MIIGFIANLLLYRGMSAKAAKIGAWAILLTIVGVILFVGKCTDDAVRDGDTVTIQKDA